MSNSELNYKRACLSCLQHDLHIAFRCLKYHSLNPHNPYSIVYKDDIDNVLCILEKLYRNVSFEGGYSVD